MALKWILSKEHEIEENSQSPDINWNSIIRIAYDFRSHVFFGTTMRLGPSTTDGSGKTEICNLVPNVVWVLIFVNFLQQNVLRLYISVNEILFVNTSQPFQDFNSDLKCLFQRESFARKFGLVCQKVSLLTVFHDNDDKIIRWIKKKLLLNSSSYRTMLGWWSSFMMLISWLMYF